MAGAARTAVSVVAGEPGGELARRVKAELERSGHQAAIVEPALTAPGGVLVFVDDAGLAPALARLIQLLPGRSIYPNAVLAAAEASTTGAMLAEGFRDVVGAGDVARAVDALLRGGAPLVLAKMRQEIEGDFLPKFVAEMRQRAKEKQTLVGECIDLLRAAAQLEKRIFRLRRIYMKQAMDELLTQDGRIEAYLTTLDEGRKNRLGRLPPFPSGSPLGGVLGKREPRLRRGGQEVDDAIDWLRQAGYLAALGKPGQEAMNETATTLKERPLQGLRDCLNIVEREIALRLSLIDRIQTQVNPVAVLEERCLERHGFGILPPGIALPESVHLILRSVIQPPPELYLSWCLDLRDLKVKQCAEVMEEIARDLAWARERPAATNGAREPDATFERDTQKLGPSQRM